MTMTCQCLSDDVRQRVYRAFQVSVCSSIGAIFVGSILSLVVLAFQFGWDIPERLSSIEIILMATIGLLSYLFLQSFFAASIMVPFALIVGFPLIFLSLRETPRLRWILYGVLGCLLALIMATAIVSYPIFWPVNYFMPVIYGACFTAAIVLFEKYC